MGSRSRGKGRSKLETQCAMKITTNEEIVGEKEKKSDVIGISGDGDELLPSPFGPSLTSSKLKLKKRKNLKGILQVDGPADSSDEDGVDDGDDDDDDDDDNDPDGEDDEGVEEEPLGSEDDISDEDASDLFDTENVVVCQFDKITRARNKWKFHPL